MLDSKSPVNSSRTRDTRADSKVAAIVRTSSNKTLAGVASSTVVKAEVITSFSYALRETAFKSPARSGDFFVNIDHLVGAREERGTSSPGTRRFSHAAARRW